MITFAAAVIGFVVFRLIRFSSCSLIGSCGPACRKSLGCWIGLGRLARPDFQSPSSDSFHPPGPRWAAHFRHGRPDWQILGTLRCLAVRWGDRKINRSAPACGNQRIPFWQKNQWSFSIYWITADHHPKCEFDCTTSLHLLLVCCLFVSHTRMNALFWPDQMVVKSFFETKRRKHFWISCWNFEIVAAKCSANFPPALFLNVGICGAVVDLTCLMIGPFIQNWAERAR